MSKVQTKSSTVKKIQKEGPVKNKSSYMFFCADERKTINAENTGLNNKEILVELGARWKVLKEENSERYQSYVKIAEEDKQRYINEKGQVQNKGNDDVESDSSEDDEKDVNKGKKTKTEKKPKKDKKDKKEENGDEDKKPKTKINGYINFCKLKRAEFKKKYSNLQPKDITRELGAAWKGLNDSEKEGYKLVQV
jgi:hypothetical protein